MKIRQLHAWDVDFKEAARIQRELAGRLRLTTPARGGAGGPGPGRAGTGGRVADWDGALVAGADVSCTRWDPRLFAAVVVLRMPTLEVVETASAWGESPFPYVSGFLSFREIPLLLRAFEQLKTRPDAVLCDGQGIAHPRRLGLAAHLGLVLGIPTVGCAKTRLVGEHAKAPARCWRAADLIHKGETVGRVLRTKTRCNPLYISPGNHVDLDASVDLVRRCTTTYRMPEPTRLAHLEVNRVRRADAAHQG